MLVLALLFPALFAQAAPTLNDVAEIYEHRGRDAWTLAAGAWALLALARVVLAIYVVVGAIALLVAINTRLTTGEWPSSLELVMAGVGVLITAVVVTELGDAARRRFARLEDSGATS